MLYTQIMTYNFCLAIKKAMVDLLDKNISGT